MTPDPVRDLLREVRSAAFVAGRQSVRWSWPSFLAGIAAGIALTLALLLV